MNKDALTAAVEACKAETKQALETVLAELNQEFNRFYVEEAEPEITEEVAE